jgi:hypothetical protein
MARRTKVTGELKSTGRAALKQYDRVTGAASDAVGSILQLPRQWAGAIVGEKNPKPYKVTKDWEFWLKDGEIYRNARTVGDTHTFAPNPKKGKSRFERCVESVTAGGSADDPRAVCAAAGRAKYGQAEMTRRSVAGRRRATRGNPPNPQEAAREMYESFHGKPAEGETLVEEEFHVHEHLSPLGVLTEFKVATITGLDATLATSEGEKDAGDYDETAARPGTVFLCSNEQGTQLYFVGGDQSLDLARLKFTGDLVKDDMVIGILYEVTYRTRKKFDKFQLTEYYHELGEETGDQPFLRYDSLSPHLAISGGKYKIKMPLIGMSPGIEN